MELSQLFANCNDRVKKIFLLLLRSDDFMTSTQLAEEVGVTSRTIKADIRTLKMELEQTELEIISKQSVGYQLKVPKYEYQKKLLNYFQIYQTETVYNDFENKVFYMLRRLLTSKDPIKVSEFQKELNTATLFTKELKVVQQMLAEYQLSLISKPYHGMMVMGVTFRKIMLLIRTYRYFDKNTSLTFGIESYDRLFSCDPEEKKNIRRIFLRTLAQSRIVFSDIHAERFFIYLLYFRNIQIQNEQVELELEQIDFDYERTEEYEVVVEIIQKLRNQFDGFDFSPEVICFLTYIAIMSTDLYRFKDCTKENYHTLIELSEEMRNFLLNEASKLFQIDCFDDYTCLKDLLKLVIPISLKQKLNVSDSVDVGYENLKSYHEEVVLQYFMQKITDCFNEQYGYLFSRKEQHDICGIFLGMLNRIVLKHRKLNLAIIAINGRLGTQSLKFNLKHYFNEYIEKIETRMLYELEESRYQKYDYYLCSSYGKNMNIPYTPIYFAEEDMSEFEYMDSLQHIFFDSFDYDLKMPKIELYQSDDSLENNQDKISLFHGRINIYFTLDHQVECFKVYKRKDKYSTEQFGILIHLSVNKDKEKLRMFLNVVNQIAMNEKLIHKIFLLEKLTYSHFFV